VHTRVWPRSRKILLGIESKNRGNDIGTFYTRWWGKLTGKNARGTPVRTDVTHGVGVALACLRWQANCAYAISGVQKRIGGGMVLEERSAFRGKKSLPNPASRRDREGGGGKPQQLHSARNAGHTWTRATLMVRAGWINCGSARRKA